MTPYCKLFFEGKVVGMRVLVSGKYYDLDIEDYLYLCYELNLQGDTGRIENLLEHNNSLVTRSELNGDIKVEEGSRHILSSIIHSYNREFDSSIELKKLHRKFNIKYFRGTLDKTVKLIYNPRLTATAGQYFMQKNKIEISSNYRRMYPQDLENVLIHEMIHQYLQETGCEEVHGSNFKYIMKGINRTGDHNIKLYALGASKARRYKEAIVCVNCGKVSAYINGRKYPLEMYACSKCKKRMLEVLYSDYFYHMYRCNKCGKVYFSDEVGEEDNSCERCGSSLREINLD